MQKSDKGFVRSIVALVILSLVMAVIYPVTVGYAINNDDCRYYHYVFIQNEWSGKNGMVYFAENLVSCNNAETIHEMAQPLSRVCDFEIYVVDFGYDFEEEKNMLNQWAEDRYTENDSTGMLFMVMDMTSSESALYTLGKAEDIFNSEEVRLIESYANTKMECGMDARDACELTLGYIYKKLPDEYRDISRNLEDPGNGYEEFEFDSVYSGTSQPENEYGDGYYRDGGNYGEGGYYGDDGNYGDGSYYGEIDVDAAQNVSKASETLSKTNDSTGYTVYVKDHAGLLTQNEAEKLLDDMYPLTETGNGVFISIDNNTEHDIMRMVEKCFYEMFDNGDDATMFMIDMDTREIAVYSDGYLYDKINNGYADTITDNVYRYASRKEYYECAKEGFDMIYKVANDIHIARPMLVICTAFMSLSIGFFVCYLIASGTSRTKRAGSKEMLKYAMINIQSGNNQTRLVNTTKRYSPRSSGGGGGHGGGHGGGGHSGGGGHHGF